MGTTESQVSGNPMTWFEAKWKEGSVNAKNCFERNCYKEASVMCKCTEKGYFSCKDHFATHTTKGTNQKNHTVVPIATLLKKSDSQKAMQSAKNLTKSLTAIELKAIENSRKLIKCINENLEKFLTNIREKEAQIRDFTKRIKEKKLVLIDLVNVISQASKCVFKYNPEIEPILSKIKKTYDYASGDPQIDNKQQTEQYSLDKEILLFNENFNLLAISTEDLTTRVLDFCPNLGIACAVSKISEYKYFIQGGYMDWWRGETYIIDLKHKEFQTLPSSNPNAHAGCAYKDKTVYIFGGCNNNISLSECCAFDMETKRFSQLPNLPQPSYANTAAEFNNKIYVSGFQLSHAFIFINNSYHQNLALSPDTYKIVFSGWIVVYNMIYEITDEGCKEWSLNCNGYSLTYLNSCCTSKWKNFIFFVDGNKMLIRINLDTKTLEQFNYY